MAKPKQNHQVHTPSNKCIAPTGLALDVDGENDWVVVKKQKVTILIPPLPVSKQSAVPSSDKSQPRTKPRKGVNVQSPSLIKPNLWRRHLETDGEKSASTIHQKTVPDFTKTLPSQPISQTPDLSKPDNAQPRLGSNLPVVNNSEHHKTFGACTASRLSKKPKSFGDKNLLLHQSLRASILERKLQRAGGLGRWLTSLGLGQFVKIFQSRRVSKFQLVNLTMKKLKDMGAVAVGPRRKLMHSIDCLCQPYCFEAL